MKVLFIGGTGIISSACSQLAIEQGIDLYLLNRGQSFRPAAEGARMIRADIRKPETVREALSGAAFDAVVDWIAFTPEHIETDLDLFRNCTGQYIFISSASAYQTPPSSLPVTESTILDNPYWEYSRNKIACEERLVNAYREEKFPMTIVRPSHTYSKTYIPLPGGYTDIARIRDGREVIVHGDGTSLWTLTHNKDFARGFIGLLGNSHAIGEAFHITSDESLTWNQIYALFAQALGVEPHLVHVPSELINAFDQKWGASLLGDKAHSMVFDNTKIKRVVPGYRAEYPFSRGVEEILAWHSAHPENQKVDAELDALIDRILIAYRSAWPKG